MSNSCAAPCARARCALWLALLLALTACGGGGDNNASNNAGNQAALPALTAPEAGAPVATGNLATDTFNWLNFRRQQAGVAVLTRNAVIDVAAQNHADYQQRNEVISHNEVVGNPGFTGVDPSARLVAAGYRAGPGSVVGEVLVATGNPQASSVVEALMVALYHRLEMLEPIYREAGVGAASVPDGYTYVGINFTGTATPPPPRTAIVYPFPNQQQLATVFYSDNEEPDPIAEQNAVGYPVSIQAALPLTVSSFTIRTRAGSELATRLLIPGTDSHMRQGTAAIIPLQPLSAATTYDVHFVGSLDGQPLDRNWSFSTR